MREAAEVAARSAYCPYSNFPVGAAVLSSEGEIFAGCNVENASFGLTICAERNAIFQAISKGRRSIRAVVIVTPTGGLAPPCGACRQVINEFGPEADVFVFGKDDQRSHFKLSELLPNAFGPDNVT
jgi:cytidine deaminase